MLRTLPVFSRRTLKLFLPTLLLLFVVNSVVAQCGYATLKHQRITGLNIGGGFISGLVQFLPADYNANPTKKYPVIIFLHGLGGIWGGPSTPDELCRIFTDQSNGLPNRIERNEFPLSVTVNGETFSYVVISPQFTQYNDPFHYSEQIDDFIDYVVTNYHVDESRIYLTGLSAGASLVMDYVSSSLAHAQRIAAASFASVCFDTWRAPAGAAANIASSGLATWFSHCRHDDNYGCVIGIPDNWVNGINASSPIVAPRYARMESNTGGFFGDAALPYCQGWTHDSWTALYSPNYTPLDAGPNLYNWQLQFQAAAALPVTLKSFTARLSNGKVYLRWVTSSEQDNEAFVLERAGSNSQFSAITTIDGGGNSSGDRVYEYVDERPLTNLSFYRLKQLDVNGRQRYFETRKVLNRGQSKKLIVITPNPFSTDPSVFISVDKKQKVSVWLTDMSGRVLSSVNGVFDQGTTELSLPAGELPRGIYLIKASGENIRETQKIIKQ